MPKNPKWIPSRTKRVIKEIDATTLKYQHQWPEHAPVKISGIKFRQLLLIFFVVLVLACSGPIHLQRSCSPQVGLSYAKPNFKHFTLEAASLICGSWSRCSCCILLHHLAETCCAFSQPVSAGLSLEITSTPKPQRQNGFGKKQQTDRIRLCGSWFLP